MIDILVANWPIAVAAAALALVLLFFLLRPRQRVSLSDNTPTRPHMTSQAKAAVGSVTTVATVADGGIEAAPHSVRDAVLAPSGTADDLSKLKGVGPKLAGLLNVQGLTRFDQIASLSPGQIDEIDQGLGAFRGRLTRDHVVDQADYLARGDIDGFEQKYGKL